MTEPDRDNPRLHDAEHLASCRYCWLVVFDPDSDELAEYENGERAE